MSTHWSSVVTYVVHYLVHAAILAVLALMLALIIKLFGEFMEDTNVEDFYSSETDPLKTSKPVFVSNKYGTNFGEDTDKANCSSSLNRCSSINENNDDCESVCNSSLELNDEKMCVICCDGPRDCFFVPCGHFSTCYACAQRIFYGESKTCPVCRGVIGKVRRLFAAS